MGMMTDEYRSEVLLTPMEAAKEASATHPTDKRTAHCRQQAAECALAATTAILGEVRQAYLNIEQAWLQLAPDIDCGRAFSGRLRKP
jgi:hypothetical protein